MCGIHVKENINVSFTAGSLNKQNGNNEMLSNLNFENPEYRTF